MVTDIPLVMSQESSDRRNIKRRKAHALDKSIFRGLVKPAIDGSDYANAPQDVRDIVDNMIEYEKCKKTFRANEDYLDPLTFWLKHAT